MKHKIISARNFTYKFVLCSTEIAIDIGDNMTEAYQRVWLGIGSCLTGDTECRLQMRYGSIQIA